ncbi:uncharacterized protein LOC102716079 [Oryza brachyantha]|uniref:Bifunctional inhibitor/plant lipid transfer protein/seed storage helical domain-containing protein n=1 Tax=Oryza brachyantha TaxID=4533 RepID=J3N8G1_ORYBR|nr:uncharacterized protein LOC102716079 [Oryza brachyantha]
MARRQPSSSAVYCFVVLLLIVSLGAAIATTAASTCEEDLEELTRSCEVYFRFPAEPRVAPSAACCGVVREVDVACLCAMVTPEVEKNVCMDKVVYVAAFCNRPFLPGSYCGSYHIPGPVV